MENILFIISPPIGGEIPPRVGPGESRSGVRKELPPSGSLENYSLNMVPIPHLAMARRLSAGD